MGEAIERIIGGVASGAAAATALLASAGVVLEIGEFEVEVGVAGGQDDDPRVEAVVTMRLLAGPQPS